MTGERGGRGGRGGPVTGERGVPEEVLRVGPSGDVTVRGVTIPVLDQAALFDVTCADGVITRIEPTAAGRADAGRTDEDLELWPGYVEAHAHLALPANWDDSLDDPRIIALQYLYHGVTHVVDMFGFPLVKAEWEAGAAQSTLPYPELVHCGYAATSMRDDAGRTGHGVEFPAPVFMLGVEGDVDLVLQMNRQRGATFLKVMFTDGTEQPGSAVRFSRLRARMLEDAARVTAARGIPAVIDCNTRAEVLQAYACGFRLFAHSVRDVELSEADWASLDGARFVSTLAGLRPMIMESHEFLAEYGRVGFRETQDIDNLDFVAKIKQPYGIEFDCQETRTAALATMRNNALAALRRGILLVGTDCGNTGAYHGYSLLSELDLLAGGDTGGDTGLRHELRRVATVEGWRFFTELAGGDQRLAGGDPRLAGGDPSDQPSAVGGPSGQPIAVGAPATFNLLAPTGGGTALSALPEVTVIKGVVIDRSAVEREIRALRTSETKGKVRL